MPDDALIISDPPYNIGYLYLGGYVDSMGEDEYIDLFTSFAGRRCVFIHYPEDTIKYIVPAMGVPKKTVSWVYNSNIGRQHRMVSWYNCRPDLSKVKQPYKNPKDKRVAALIDGGSEGTALYDWWEIDLVKNVSSEKTKYTNQIPERLVSNIIKTTAHDDDVIIDPFCGSGTTCAVAEKLGFNWAGLDISKIAVATARARVADIQNNLFCAARNAQ